MINRLVFLCLFAGGSLLASGGKTGGGGGGTTPPGVTPPGSAEVRTLSEIVPAGGTVQVKYLFTQPRPISSGGGRFTLSGLQVGGVALFSPLGDTIGTAVMQNGSLYLSVFSPSSDFGTNLDYPFLTMTMDIPQSMPAGTVIPLGMPDMTFQSPTGPLTLTDPKPGTLTLAGSLSVRSIYPGGGTWGAGTIISVRGMGFTPGTKISTRMKTTPASFVSSTEMRFTLQQQTTLDQQPIDVTNPDGSHVQYFSYLRGSYVQTPSRPLLQNTDPIFAANTQAIATIGPLPASGPGQFTGLAIQNPTQGPVAVAFQLQSTGLTTILVLPSGSRAMEDLSTLLGGAAVKAGDTVTVSAASAIQMLGLTGDETAWTVTPFAP